MTALRLKVAAHVLTVGAVLSLGAVASPAFADDPFLGEIRVFGFNFCPNGWVAAQGQTTSIAQNTALFALMGVTYGGDGVTNFRMVDAQGRSLVNVGAGPGLTQRMLGEVGGVPTASLSANNLPAHSHLVNANNLDGDKPGPGGKLLAAAPPNGAGSETIYSDQPATVTMAASMIANAGQSQAISVADPSLAMTVCIATVGIFPQRP